MGRTDDVPGASGVFAPFAGKRVLFVTTKNVDYIRNTQEIAALRATAKSVEVLGSADKSYPKRLIKIYKNLAFKSLRGYDAVFVGFAPQLVLPVFGRRFKGLYLAEDFFISLYDTMVDDRKKFASNSLPARFMHRIDEKTLRGADLVVADTRAHADFFAAEFSADREKLRVLYLQADRSIYYPREVKKAPGVFTVLYFGSILPLQGTETILECIRLLKDRPDIHFEMIGPVGEAEKSKCEGANVRFTPWLSQPELADRIAAADLCLAGHFNARIGKALRTIPGKAYIYEAMGKPMILGDNPANRELFAEDNTRHFFVRMGDADSLKEKILFAADKKPA